MQPEPLLLELQERMKGVRNLLEDSKWNEASSAMSDILQQALGFYKDELAVGMAEYYYMMGNVLVCKIENTQDLFGNQVKRAEGDIMQNTEEQEESESEADNAEQEVSIHEEKEEKMVEPQAAEGNQQQLYMINRIRREELEGEQQLAWENLETACVILTKEYARLLNEQFGDIAQRTKVTKHLARVHLRKAELEQWRDNFLEALIEHKAALELRLQVEDLEKSRDVAESYFLIGNTELYNNAPDCDVKAMKCYKSALQILENNLSDDLTLPRRDVSNIELENPTIFHLNASFLDTPSITELKCILRLLYEKIEDLKLSLQESQSEAYKQALKEQEEMKQQQTQVFSEPQLPNKPVVNLGQFGNAAKRKVEAEQVNSANKENKEADESLEPAPVKKVKED